MWQHYWSKEKDSGWLWGEGHEVGTQEGKGRREPSLPGRREQPHRSQEEEQLRWCLESSLWRTTACRVKAWHLGGNRSHFGPPKELHLDRLSQPSCFSSPISLPLQWGLGSFLFPVQLFYLYVGFSSFPALLHFCVYVYAFIHKLCKHFEYLLLARHCAGHCQSTQSCLTRLITCPISCSLCNQGKTK